MMAESTVQDGREMRMIGEIEAVHILSAQDAASQNLMLGSYLKLYMERCRDQRRLDAKTIKAYRCDIIQFMAWLDEGRFEFDRESMRSYVAHLNHKWSASTVRRKLASLKAWANWLKRERLIAASPFEDLEINVRMPLLLPRRSRCRSCVGSSSRWGPRSRRRSGARGLAARAHRASRPGGAGASDGHGHTR